MTTDPLVFIIIVNWNGKEITLDCLRSVQGVTYKNTRTVVVDNASSDGSVAAIQRDFPGVALLEMKENLRFAGGNNAGITYSLQQGADMVLLLNNDTTVHPDFLGHLVTRFLSAPGIGMAAPKIYYHDHPRRLWFAGGEISMWTGTMKHTGIREIDRGQHDVSKEIDYATGCCLLTSREVVQKTGMLDETFFMYTEDADWSMRVRRAGYRIVYEPNAHVWHKLSVSAGGHMSIYKMRNKFFSNLQFFKRYAAWYQFLVFPWANMLVNVWTGVKFAVFKGKFP